MAWSPLQIPNAALFVSGAHTKHMWTEYTSGTTLGATTPGLTSLVGQVEDGAGGFNVWAPSSGTRPTLNGSGGKSWFTFGGGTRFQITNSKGLRFLHRAPSATILIKGARLTAATGLTQYIFDGTNATNGAVGFSLYVNSSGQLSLINADGSASILSSGLNTTATLSSNTFHDLICVLDQAGTGLVSLQIDSTTAVTRTYANAGNNADATNNYYIGARGSAGTSPWGGDMKSITVVSGLVSAGDMALWRAYDPDTTSTSLCETTAGGNILLPTDVPFLHRWYDSTDANYAYKLSDMTTGLVATPDTDYIGRLECKKPIRSGSSWNRPLLQATTAKRPLYKSGQANGFAAAYFNGNATGVNSSDFTNEIDLALASTDPNPSGSTTTIAAYQNLDDTQGSHVFCCAAGTDRYGVQTGAHYNTSGRGDFVVHPLGTASSSLIPTNPNGLNIWSRRTEGANEYQYQNAGLAAFVSNSGVLDWGHIGRPQHANAGASWDMYGPVYIVLVYNAILPEDTMRKVVNYIANRLAATAAYTPARGGGGGLYCGLGLRM